MESTYYRNQETSNLPLILLLQCLKFDGIYNLHLGLSNNSGITSESNQNKLSNEYLYHLEGRARFY
jgi:hypothetical protein